MKIQKKSLLWGLFFLMSLILVAIGGAYVGRNFTGIGPVPTRSAFAGRLPSISEKDPTLFRFFYTTNRDDSDDTFNERGNILGIKY